jgi:hypothetical protein
MRSAERRVRTGLETASNRQSGLSRRVARQRDRKMSAGLFEHPSPYSLLKPKFHVALIARFGILLCASDGKKVP